MFNRFQLSSDARPQGAVYSTASLRSARFIRIAWGKQGRQGRQGGGAGRAGLSELPGTHPHREFDLFSGVQHRTLPDTYPEGPFGTVLFVLEGRCGI